MSFVLVDWTRMGRGYCLAGAMLERDGVRVVRPLLRPRQSAAVAAAGLIVLLRSLFIHDPPVEVDRRLAWAQLRLAGRLRWEVFDLVSARPASPQAPHLEDTWVRSLRPRKRLATREERRKILEATVAKTAEAIFGAELRSEGQRTFVKPGEGTRSLSTLLVPSAEIEFHLGHRAREPGAARILVNLPFPELGIRSLPVTDHYLLTRAESEARTPKDQAGVLNRLVREMGETVTLRLGLSRPFEGHGGAPVCWVMANGFFSFADPQP